MDDVELILTLRGIFVKVVNLEVSATRNEILMTLEHLVNYDDCQRAKHDRCAAELNLSQLKLLFGQFLSVLGGHHCKLRECLSCFLAHVCKCEFAGYWLSSDL